MLREPGDRSRLPSYWPLLIVATAAAAGILVDRYLGAALGSMGLFCWWLLAAVLAIVCYLLRRANRGQLSAVTLLASIAALGAAWHHQNWNYLAVNHLARFAEENSQPICLEAVAVNRMRWTPAPPANPLSVVPQGSRSEVTVEITRVRDGETWLAAAGQCRLRVEGELANLERGDRLLVFGQFGRPRQALNPGQYPWAKAERGAGRFVELFCRVPQCVSVVEPRESLAAGRWFDRLAYWCQHQLTRYVGAEHGDLALALTFGQRERLDESAFEAFLKTGTVHLLVVSGLHVGFLAGFVWLFVRTGVLPQRSGIFVSALLVIGYAAIVGGRPPVLRATVLVLIALAAMVIGRRTQRANLLAAAALVVLLINPSELFRGGTQLSFLSVAAISAYAAFVFEKRHLDPLQRLIRENEPWARRMLRVGAIRFGQLFVVSLVIWLVAAPLVAHHFHMTAPVSVLLTPIVWPLVALAMAAGLAICTVGWIVPPAAYLLGGVASAALGVIQWLVTFADSLALGHFYCPGPPWWWLLGLYGALAGFALFTRYRINWKWQVATIALWAAVGLGMATLQQNHNRLHCTFLAMGHGTCVVLELPGGQTLLYDAGSLGSPEGASRTVASYLWSRGITHVDAVVLSHADIDHYNAMPGLIERVPVGTVYVSPLMFDPWATEGQLTGPNYLRETLAAAGVPMREVWMNDRLEVAHPDLQIDVLHPPRTGVPGRDNANSILLNINYAGYSILLPGDLESPGIETVMADPALDCDILLAPHHGSAGSDPPGFAAWCTPGWVVVSGRDSRDLGDFTAASYRDIGARVLHTADRGATQFTLAADSLQVSTFRDGIVGR